MKKRIEHIMYFIAAMLTSNVVYVIDAMHNAATAADAPTCQQVKYETWIAGRYPAQDYEGCKDRCTTMFGSNASGSFGSDNESARCACWSSGYRTHTFDAFTMYQQCGIQYWCGSGSTATFMRADCYTEGWAGYAVNTGGIRGTFSCACCPGAGTGGQINSELGSGETANGNVFARSLPNAMSASDCYIVGTIADETGLFQYTDSNECHYEE